MKLSYRKLLIFFFLMCLFAMGAYVMFFNANITDAAWYQTAGWKYRKKMVIDESKVSGTSNLTNFPVLISRTDLDLKNFAQSDGDDILFTSSDGTTKLDHEIESYNSTTGTLVAWVEVPTVDYDDDTTIFMYYGNSSASNQQNAAGVWSSNYISVWHLNENVTDEQTSGTHIDSSSSVGGSENGTQNNNDDTTGKIDSGQDFDNTADFINVGDDPDLDFANGLDFSVTAWAKLNSTASTEMILAKKDGTGGGALGYLFRFDSGGALRIDIADTATNQYNRISTSSVSAGMWNYVGFTFDESSEAGTKLFINGSATGETDDGSSDLVTDILDMTSTKTFRIGAESDGGNAYNGQLDEVRVANTILSDDWIATEYNNQGDPAGFFKAVSPAQVESQTRSDLYYGFSEGSGTTIKSKGSNHYTGTISGATWQSEDQCVTDKCLYFDGSNDVVTTTGATSSVKTVAFWVKPLTTTEQFVDLNGTAYIQSSSGTISATGFTSPTIYVDGKVSSTLVANEWQHVIVTTSSGLNASALKLGQISTNYGQIFMDEFQLYSTQLSSSQVLALFNARGGGPTSVQIGQRNNQALSEGLLGYWKLDANTGTSAIDSSGNGLTGTLTNSPTWGSGKFGPGVTFGNSTNHVSIGDQSALELQKFTVSAWIYRTSTCGSFNICVIYSKGSSSNTGFRFELNAFGSRPYNLQMKLNDTQEVRSTSEITTNKWYHVAATVDGSTVRVYVNGILETETAQTQTPAYGAESVEIGNGNTANDLPFTGTIDEVRVYNRVLSPQEVNLLYDWSAPPVGYWNLDQNTGTTANDLSSLANNGTLTGVNTKWSVGKYGSGVSTEGDGDYVNIPDNDAYSISTTNQLTVSGWIYPRSFSVGAATWTDIISKGSGGNYEWTIREAPTGQVSVHVFNTLANNYLNVEPAVNNMVQQNQWAYITFVADFNSPSLKLYINGVLIGEDTTTSGSYSNGTAPVRFGERGDGNNEFNGIIDDVIIYNYARTQKQILQDMNASHPTVGTPVSSTVGHWSFDEGYGTTANDKSGNSNNLTLSTASWTNSGKFAKAWNGTGSLWLSRSSDDDELDFSATDDFSISIWFKSDSTTNPASNSEFLITKGTITNTGTAGYALYAKTDGTIVFGIKDDSAWGASSPNTPSPDDTATSTTDLYDNTWHHLVATKTSTSRIDLYIDGKLNASDTSIAAVNSLANSIALRVGDDDSDSANSFAGDIDEVKIYRAALTSDDVKVEYNQGKTLVLGSLSTSSDGTTANNSSDRSYCIPGDTSTCRAPVGEWNFEENSGITINDTSGSGISGTLRGQSKFAPGKVGTGLDLNGTANTGVKLTNNAFNSYSSGTIAAWVKFGDIYIDSRYNTIFGVGADDNSVGADLLTFYIDYNTDLFGLVIYDESAVTSVVDVDASYSNDGKWHYLAVTMDSSGASLFMDGRKQSSTFHAGSGVQKWFNNLTDATTAYTIGCLNLDESQSANPCPYDRFGGQIDQVKVYDYARTPAQIAWDYNRGGPSAWYKFDECTGTTINDSSGNSNTGTINAGASGNTSAGNCGSGTSTEMWNDGSSGMYNYSLGFDAADDYVSAGTGASLATLEAFSVSAWIKPNSSGEGTVGRVVDKAKWFLATTDTNALEFDVTFASATLYRITSNNVLTSGQWNHVLVTHDGTTSYSGTKIYVNGKEVGYSSNQNGSGSRTSDSSDVLYIGNRAATDRTFDGLIDDLRIYPYALYQTQIYSIFNQNSTVRFAPPSGHP